MIGFSSILIILLLLAMPSMGFAQFVDITPPALADPGNGSGAAWGDYDQDGDEDLYLSNSSPGSKLFRNEGSNVFIDVTGAMPGALSDNRGCAWGDYDDDGDLDLFLAVWGGTDKVIRNEGGGVFSDVTSGPIGNNGNATGAAWVDYDSDSDVDVLVSQYGPLLLWRNDGLGTFVNTTPPVLGPSSNWNSSVWGDYDRDGDPDVYICNGFGTSRLVRNDGFGSFVDVTSAIAHSLADEVGAAWGDYDNDLDLDLCVATFLGPTLLFRNEGNGSFSNATQGALLTQQNGQGVTWWDYDNDADLDLYATCFGTANRLFRNDSGSMVEVPGGPLNQNAHARGAACADTDQDGDLDIFVVNHAGPDKLFRNDGNVTNHWLDVQLVGRGSCIGAQVTVWSGGMHQLREISGGSGYLCQNSLLAHFGLGDMMSVDSVSVRWPSGVTEVFPGPPVNGVFTVSETVQFVNAAVPPLNLSSNGRGVSLEDYDLDGDLDIYLVNYIASNRLFRNEGSGTFVTTGQLAANGEAGVWGDYDNDGDPDMYVCNLSTSNRLYRNEGNGTFINVTAPPLGDTGTNHFASWGDFDGDGDLDLYLARGTESCKMFRNEGGGAFTNVTSGALGQLGGVSLAPADYDLDGDLDIFIAAINADKYLRNDGGMVFVDATSGPLGDTGSSLSATPADYDNDGDLDIYIGNYSGLNKLLRNDGSGVFVNVTTGLLGLDIVTHGVAWGDFDNDGWIDVYVVSGYAPRGPSRLLRNLGSGTFVDQTTVPMQDARDGYAAAWGDLDQDGDLDLYRSNNGKPNQLFRNEIGSANHWINIKLVGTMSNRSAIGAQVVLYWNGQKQMQEVSGGSGFLSQNSLAIEFGLGTSTEIDSIVVRWPSGLIQRKIAPDVDQFMTMVEGDVTGIGEDPLRPAFVLYPAAPNPAKAATTLRFELPESARARASVLDVEGRLVRVLLDHDLPAGPHAVTWDGRDRIGRLVASGLYFLRLEGRGVARSKSVVITGR